MSETGDNAYARVLARFGASPSDPEIVSGEEQAILTCLGAAVIACWADLPRDIQRRLYEAATNAGCPGREEIALFLHAHHRDTADRSSST